MKPRSRLPVSLPATLTIAIMLSSNPGELEQEFTIGHRESPHLVAYFESTAPCRTGWWQTLHYGHVRPRWATFCYRTKG
jgi:hypothetical protein